MPFRALGRWSLAGLLGVVLASACAASVPALISYQGKLTNNASGSPVPDGVYDVTFSLFAQPTGGTAAWTESRTVQTLGGVFTVLLGSLNPLPESAFTGDTWLETAVGGVTLAPRIQLVTAGYAQVASVADSVADGAITTNKMPDGAVTEEKLDSVAVISDRLAAGSVTTPAIADGSVTDSKLSADARALLNQTLRSAESVLNVKDFGAVGNGSTDDTSAFQSALDTASAAKGGVVIVPTGRYKIAGHLSVPSNVTLEGVAQAPPQKVGWMQVDTVTGSILLASEGEGNAGATPFITLGQWNSGLKGLIIYYPNQLPTLATPLVYPWTIEATNANNTSIIDCTAVNPYQCVNIDGGGKHYIRGLYGQPLYRGVVVDNCSDMRVENIHFWPFNTGWMYTSQNTWQLNNGVAFLSKRCDWLYVTNAFVLGYNIGFQFVAGTSGNTHGSLIGIGIDASSTDLKVDSCSSAGILVTNGEFVGNQSPVAKPIIVGPNVGAGVVRLNNCSFWGANYRIADVQSGTVSFTNCTLSEFQTTTYAIYSTGGKLSVRNCYFRTSGYGVRAGTGTTGCVIMGNQGLSSSEILNEIGSACVIANNKS
ncbi:MAG: glycosyl hydrolase family 28-related protein [Armatimonadota bacterium]|nr:glycosyl hydrolase family 28-related protein [Armatimonadota bacterium]